MNTKIVRVKLTEENTVANISMTNNHNIFNCEDKQIRTEYMLLWFNVLADKLSTKIKSFNCSFDSVAKSIIVTNKHNKKISIKGLNALQIVLDESTLKFI